jgi:hypothetical protein
MGRSHSRATVVRSTYNAKTGKTNTWDSASVGNNRYADAGTSSSLAARASAALHRRAFCAFRTLWRAARAGGTQCGTPDRRHSRRCPPELKSRGGRGGSGHLRRTRSGVCWARMREGFARARTLTGGSGRAVCAAKQPGPNPVPDYTVAARHRQDRLSLSRRVSAPVTVVESPDAGREIGSPFS